MPEDAPEALRGATFRVHPAPFCIVGLRADTDLVGLPRGPWTSVLRTGDELTLMLPEADWDAALAAASPAPAPAKWASASVERGWRLLSLEAEVPWDVAGVLADLTTALADRGIPCAVLCAFTTDHLLVPEARWEEALTVLQACTAT